MDSRPKLPPRRQERGRKKRNEGVIQDPDLAQLRKQLLGHPVFQQLADQPEKLAAVFQDDPILQHAAAANPELAQLLDPATMRQALQVIMQPGPDSTSATNIQLPRKALMQLQNYAMQLQHNTAAVKRQQQQQQQQQQKLPASRGDTLHSQVDTDAADQHPGCVSVQQQHMWDALQQRFNKLHHRSQALGTAEQQQQQHFPPTTLWPAVPQRWNQQQQQPPRILETLVESPLAAGSAMAAGAVLSAASDDFHNTRVSDGNRTMEELLAAFPGMLCAEADGPLCSSHATIGLMSAVQPIPQGTAGLHTRSLANTQQTLLTGNRSVLTPFSPDWQQQQQSEPCSSSSSGDGTTGARESTGRPVWPLSGSDPAVSCAEAAGPAPPRPSSALGHRILRPHSSSPIPLGSGSTPLGITQLGSGELVVEITPPTKVTTEISWSVDPDASYVLDASTSGSIGGLAAVPGAMSAASSTHRSSSTNLEGFDSAVLARSSSGGLGGYIGVVLSTDPRLDAAEVAAAAAAAADATTHAARVSSSSSSNTEGTGKEAQTKRSRQAAAAGTPASLLGKAAKRPAILSATVNKVRQHQQAREQSQGAQLAGIPAGRAQQPAGISVPSSGCHESALPVSHGPPNSADALLGTISLNPVTAPSTLSSSGAVKAMLSPGSYYEDVAPSSWRPTDASEYPGDYLELYRRAYCSYADALFPPVWLMLTAALASSRLLSFWQLLLVGLLSFWGGVYIMAVRWAGVPTKQLSLSRVAPVLVASLEITCFGAFILHVLPVMWLGHAAQCLLLLVCGVSTLALHLLAHLQDPGYSTIPDAEEGRCTGSLPLQSAPTNNISGPPAAVATAKPGSQTAAVAQLSAAGFDPHQQDVESNLLLPAAASRSVGPGSKKPPPTGGPKLAGRSLTSCWTCGVERNLRSKHCPVCKRCVERFDHHCPVIGNCVGARNHKTFVMFLITLFICQILFAQLLGGVLMQQHVQQQVSGIPPSAFGLPMTSTRQHSGQQSVHLLPTHAMAATAQPTVSIAGSSLGNVAAITAGMGLKSVSAVSDSSMNQAEAGNTDYSANIVISNTVARGIDSTNMGHVPVAGLMPLAAPAAATTTVTGSTHASIVNLAAAAAATDGIVPPGTAAVGTAGDPVRSRAAELEVLLAAGGWSWQVWWLRAQALWTAADSSKGLLLLLLLQGPGLFISCSLLFRALFLAAANLTVNEWLNRSRYLYLQHSAAGFCNRFDRGPAHNCWEFWCGPAVVDWWEAWQQGDEEMSLNRQSVLTAQSATVLIRFWDVRWAKYQQKLTAARERKRERQLQRRMAALGLADKTHG